MVSNKLSSRRSSIPPPKICFTKYPPFIPPLPPLPEWPPIAIHLHTQLDEPDYGDYTHRTFDGNLPWDPETGSYHGLLTDGDAYWSGGFTIDVANRNIEGTFYGEDSAPHYWGATFDPQPLPDPWTAPYTLTIGSSYGSMNEIDVISPA